MARVWAICRCSGADLGCGADFIVPDATPRIALGPVRAAPQPKPAPEQRSIVRLRAVSSAVRTQVRLIELWDGHGRFPSSTSYTERPRRHTRPQLSVDLLDEIRARAAPPLVRIRALGADFGAEFRASSLPALGLVPSNPPIGLRRAPKRADPHAAPKASSTRSSSQRCCITAGSCRSRLAARPSGPAFGSVQTQPRGSVDRMVIATMRMHSFWKRMRAWMRPASNDPWDGSYGEGAHSKRAGSRWLS